MHVFFLIFFIFISISLIGLILLQPGKEFNNIIHSNIKNNIKLFNNFGSSGLMTKIISIFSCLFLVISIILCILNNSSVEQDYFWKNHKKNTIINSNTSFMKKKELNTDVPR